MFNNAGKKIQLIAKIMFWVCVAAYVICGFKFGFTTYYTGGRYSSTKHTEFNGAIFFGCLVLGPVVSYIAALVTIAFGQLVENSQTIADSTAGVSSASSAASSVSSEDSEPAYRPLFKDETTSKVYRAPVSTVWTCSSCGKTNPGYSNGCSCGQIRSKN